MKSQVRTAIALFGGAIILAVGFAGGSELLSSTTTTIATPPSTITPVPSPSAAPGDTPRHPYDAPGEGLVPGPNPHPTVPFHPTP